ncbi:hypothetical protein CXG81DRAFT_25663 [Caulochytrium protostelioides]|uniref:RNA polymerase Rpb4/RPC9 core domain-containing protein n=1 Tax=Caulochytrium protostelioides TaxID=1555241 RepID=A0A4P9X8R0_9FUNG|nr:hypothetical protein CXG81DRAFT_25663 [Caulochytrium protostelioides]|eukprot:RKP01694.1 hypothetical protein CXG81DRAFT_25663 [Caulochytrium protostelioides]
MSRPVPGRRALVEEDDASQHRFGADFESAQCLLVSEVRALLDAAKDQREKSGQVDIITRTHAYCERFSRLASRETIKEVRALFPSAMHPFDFAQLANLGCETVEEALSLIPSLHGVMDHESLQRLLDDLASLRQF